ncbi:MAG: zinc ribbon domain-containing protein [Chloroflexaceae bacterium]|nr:zinc ribbon domain-containing protein [Chloroflexaceae bacterium]
MPLYVYVCPECEIELEERRATVHADWPPVECPVCYGLCERTISRFSVRSRSTGADSRRAELIPPRDLPAAHRPDCACCRPKR